MSDTDRVPETGVRILAVPAFYKDPIKYYQNP
jgi:hypothetical protein